MSSVYAKTQLGVSAIQASRESLNPIARRLLILVDGQRDVEELSVMLGPEAVRQHLPFLVNEGYVWPVQASAMGVPRMNPVVHGAGAPATPQPVATDLRGEAPVAAGRVPLAARAAGLLVVLGAGAGIWWWYTHTSPGAADASATGASAAPAPLPQPITIAPAAPIAAAAPRPDTSRAGERRSEATSPTRAEGRSDGADRSAKARKADRASEAATPAPAAAPNLAAASVTAPAVPGAAAPAPSPSQSPAPATLAAPRPAPGATASAAALPRPIAEAAAPATPPAVLVDASPRAAPASAPPTLATANPAPSPAAVNLRVRNRVLPELPRRAKRLGIDHGQILARLHVNAAGTVDQVELVRANPPQVYDDQVQQTLAQWTFEPPGQAVIKNIELNFKP